MNRDRAARRLRRRRAATARAAAGGVAWAPARCGCTPTTRSRPRPAAMCRAAAAPPSASPAWSRAAASAASPSATASAAASLLEAEVVTADGAGAHRQCLHQSRPVLGAEGRRRRQPRRRHAAHAAHARAARSCSARRSARSRRSSDAAFRRLIERFVAFYRESLFNPHWGEQVALAAGQRAARSRWCSRASTRAQARGGVAAVPRLGARATGRRLHARCSRRSFSHVPARAFVGRRRSSSRTRRRSCCRRPARRLGDQRLLARRPRARPAGSCTATSRRGCRRRCCSRRGAAACRRAVRRARRHWGVALHFNKGLAGAPAEALAAARDTATNPAVIDAFALAISGAEERAGLPGHRRPRARPRRGARDAARDRAPRWASCARSRPTPGSYVSESNYFEADWQQRVLGRELRAAARGEGPGTTPTACSSSTTASAARTGAPTASRG